MKHDIAKITDKAEANLQRKLDWIGRHDTRAAFVAGGSIAMLGVLANASALITTWTWYCYLVFGITFILLSVSLILIYCGQYPKTESRNASLIFFGTIAELKSDEFRKQFKDRSDEDYLEDLLSQIHINAEILNKKFHNLKSALKLMGISVLPWLVAIYLSKIYLK